MEKDAVVSLNVTLCRWVKVDLVSTLRLLDDQRFMKEYQEEEVSN